MGLLGSLGFKNWSDHTGDGQVEALFNLRFAEADFIAIDLRFIYSRILADALSRTTDIPEDRQKLLWDNCLGNESQDGLITMVTKAMVNKSDLCILFDKALELVRKATAEEEVKIKEAIKGGKEYPGAIYVTFKNYDRTDMLKIYSAMEYCTVSALYKTLNVSKVIQYKIDSLRASVALGDNPAAQVQATKIVGAIKLGKDTYFDSKDSIEMAKPDLTATNSAMEFIAQKRSFYLELPASYIIGLIKTGLGDSGEADARAVDRGLKPYYYSIIKPIVEALFGITTTFKSDDHYGISTAGEMLKTFNVTDEELISLENKTKIINRLFGLPEDAEGDGPAEPPPPPVVPGAPPVKPPAEPPPPQ